MDFTLVKKYFEFFYAIGFFSEIITLLIVICLIYKNYYHLFFYIIGFIFNSNLSVFLKNIIKQPRPKGPIKFLNSEHFSNKSISYGMPSGHSQNVFFSIVYLYFSIPQFIPWVLFTLVIGLLTIYERWHFHNHTIRQLFAGALIGSFVAYAVIIVREIIENTFLEKKQKIPIQTIF
jgi:membrane-associated phospholipid phosphatase